MAKKLTPSLPATSHSVTLPNGTRAKCGLPVGEVIRNIDKWKRDDPQMAADPYWGPFYDQVRAGAAEELKREQEAQKTGQSGEG